MATPERPRLVDAVPFPKDEVLLFGSRLRVFRPCAVVLHGRLLAGVVRLWVLDGRGRWVAQVEHEDPARDDGATIHAWYVAGSGLLECKPVLPQRRRP